MARLIHKVLSERFEATRPATNTIPNHEGRDTVLVKARHSRKRHINVAVNRRESCTEHTLPESATVHVLFGSIECGDSVWTVGLCELTYKQDVRDVYGVISACR